MLCIVVLATLQGFIGQQIKTMVLTPTDDAYVVADLNDPSDKLGLRRLNFGGLKFLKTWYAWNVTGEGEKVFAIIYLKFNLPTSASRIKEAVLELFAQRVDITDAFRPVDVHLVDLEDGWSEQELNFSNAPSFERVPSSTTYVSESGRWYGWDVTAIVRERVGSNVTFLVTLRSLYLNEEEQVVFVSKEAQENRPKLSITYVEEAPWFISVQSWWYLIVIVASITTGLYVARRIKELRKYPKEMVCPRCEKMVEPDFKLCPYCGYEISLKGCPSCGKEVSPNFRLCPYCGKSLKAE